MENCLVTFQNMFIKLCYYYLDDTDISYLEITNDLVKNPVNKFTNEEIPMPDDYLEPKKSCQ